jgi:hypothetical protein
VHSWEPVHCSVLCALVSNVNHIPRTDQNILKEEIGTIPKKKENCLFQESDFGTEKAR